MKNCKDYTDCVFYKAVETDYDVTNGTHLIESIVPKPEKTKE